MIINQGGHEIFVIKGGGYEKLLQEERNRKSKIKGVVNNVLCIIVYAKIVVFYV